MDRLIGRGGFARVFLSTDLVLQRQVAIKVLHADLAGHTGEHDFLGRFRQEARAIAALDHPNILGIHDYGEADGVVYLVMPYIEGESLHDRIAARPLELREITGYLRQVAAALDYAHRRSIVHRDIKPQNMLLRAEDDRLLLADFGIAKVLSGVSAQSQTGVLGTIAYMAPEQFQGRIGPAVDIYALGCVLFQMLTGQPPYDGSTEQVIYSHLNAPIPSLRERSQGRLPQSLQPVIDRALAKRAEERYTSAGELAGAFAAIAASVEPPAWPSQGTTAGVAPASPPVPMLADPPPATSSGLDRTSPAQPPMNERTLAAGAAARTIAAAGRAPAQSPLAATGGQTPQGATEHAVPVPPASSPYQPPPAPPRVWPGKAFVVGAAGASVAVVILVAAVIATLIAGRGSPGQTVTPTRSVTSTAVPTAPSTAVVAGGATATATMPPTATATTLVTATASPTVPATIARPPLTGASPTILNGHTDHVRGVAWTPDGNRLISGGGDGTVRLWRADGTTVATFAGRTFAVTSVALSPDAGLLAVGSDDYKVHLWRADGTPVAILSEHTDNVVSVAWSPDGQTLASASWDRTVLLWSADGRLLRTITGHTDVVQGVAWSPDGGTLASVSWDKTVRLWRPDGTPVATLQGHTDQVWGVAWSPSGNILASGSRDGTVRLWSSEGKPIATLQGHTSYVSSVVWSPDGATLASAGFDATVRLWSAEGEALGTLTGHTDMVTCLAWSADGKALVSGSWDKTLRIWR